MSETGTKHTPGPWVLLPQSFSPRIYIMREGYGSDDAAVANVCSRYDARLIAAAPDLLEALTDLVQLEGGRFGTGEIKPGTYGAAVMNAARDAIAKATGES